MTRTSGQSLQKLITSWREESTKAAAHFQSLSDFEIRVLRACATGDRTIGSPTSTLPESSPERDGIDRMGTIRAEVLRWFLLDRTLAECLYPDGVKIQNARIVGELDLGSTRILFPLTFEACVFEAPITLLDSECRSLTFNECQLTSIVGDRLICRGGIWITACKTQAEVRFLAATIAGDLTFSGSHFNGLSLDGIDVSGSVLLDDGFTCRGGVRLPGAHIKGNLGCRAALLQGSRPDAEKIPASEAGLDGQSIETEALIATAIRVGGEVLLYKGFRAEGAVLLQRVEISGGLHCDGGQFRNPGATALSVIFGSIANEVRMGSGFVAEGVVDFNTATVGGQFNCDGGHFHNAGNDALVLDSAHIRGMVVLGGDFLARGTVRLRSARCDGDVICAGATFINKGNVALMADGSQITGGVDLARSRIVGGISFGLAEIGDQFVLAGARVLNRGHCALRSQGLTVQKSLLLTEGFRCFGEIDLSYSTIHVGLECSHSRISNRSGVAITLCGANIVGDLIFFETSFLGTLDFGSATVNGDARVTDLAIGVHDLHDGEEPSSVSFERASILGTLRWAGVSQGQGTRVAFTNARVGMLSDHPDSWPEHDCLDLRGFRYDDLTDIQPLPEARLAWLGLQPAGVFSVQPYEQLIAWARRTGRQDAAVGFAIAREEALMVNGSLGRIQSAWHWFLGVSMAYGYKPLRLIYAAAVLILVGWGVFGYASAHAAMTPSKPADASLVLPVSYPRFSSLMYSVDTFLPIIDFYQEGYWIPNTHIALGRAAMAYLWFHTAMGWALSTLAVIGFSGLVRKE